jgi:anti-sigma regulatory factor (Ser/Thr protein kinase)
VSESGQSGIDEGPGPGRPSAEEARPGPVLSQTYPAVPKSVAAIRATVGSFATQIGASRSTIDNARLAASEAASNVVVHAYHSADEPGLIHVEALLAAGELRVSVTDTGTGLQAGHNRPGLGLGLALIGQLADHVELVQGDNGGLYVLMCFAVPANTRPT